ncbi:MAG: class I SAM-dependent methyltransferase [Candidatus Kuenenia sp.]|nr:class I SAM-dependent methyltransferase [Candidatus Kuenenia hertensis]
MKFYQSDIFQAEFPAESFDIITMISVLQHIGVGDYGERYTEGGDVKVIKEIARILKKYGLLLLTTPTENLAKFDDYPLKGYNYITLKVLTSEFFEIMEYEERRGHICVALIKR